MLDSLHLPRWLEALLAEKFFNACIIHEDEKKNEKNIFCLDCCESICPHCLTPHRSHRLLQIRRYVYHDVIRLGDAEKLMDCASVQLQHILRTEGEISEHLYECEVLTLPEPVLDDGTTTPDSVLDPAVSLRTTSASSGSGCGGGVNCRALACTATTEVVRKKRSSMSAYRAACRPVFSPVTEANRRKGTPQRSPLY
ncbi:hypothetical protein RJ639_034207 [Escallonia herrerae]|uniref:B box-type domain-containing protein n=1 Tax=Escallonia herrerae TaxID=1293975 RepID=A0AA89B9S9_9ASTE|nr:hypothetical protein RJ639_034207 [Escallonia herrerae]